MDCKSHTKKEIQIALQNGEPVWALDTPDGDDDILIGDLDESVEILREFHGFDTLPEGWTFEKVTLENCEAFGL